MKIPYADSPELVQNADDTRPEVAYSDAPEVVFDDDPEVVLDTKALLPLSNHRYPRKRLAISTICNFGRGRRIWFLLLVVAMLVISFRVTLKTRHGAAPATRTIPLSHGALNDTSLASVSTSDGNRHLFFQDINGTLRHALYSPAFKSWRGPLDFILLERQPRFHTPLSATEVACSWTTTCIHLYYVDIDDMLAAVSCIPGLGLCRQFPENLNLSVPVSTQSRSLSISRVYSHRADLPSIGANMDQAFSWDTFLLFYEDPSGKVTVLHGNYFKMATLRDANYNVSDSMAWRDFSGPFYAKLSNDAWISSPFAILINTADNYISGIFHRVEPHSEASSRTFVVFEIDNISSTGKYFFVLCDCLYLTWPKANGSALQHSLYYSKQNLTIESTIHFLYNDIPTLPAPPLESESDFLYFNRDPCFVMGNVLHIGRSILPNSEFPFARLATAMTENMAFIYHQINESLLMEETQHRSLGIRGFGEANSIIISTE